VIGMAGRFPGAADIIGVILLTSGFVATIVILSAIGIIVRCALAIANGASDDAEYRQVVGLNHSCELDYLPTNGQSLVRR
jgi:hypothetical protein